LSVRANTFPTKDRNNQDRRSRNKKRARRSHVKTFGSVIAEARKRSGLTQMEVVSLLRRGRVEKWHLSNFSSLEHDQRYRPSDEMIEKLAQILGLSADVLYFYANRVPRDIRRDVETNLIESAYIAFRRIIDRDSRRFRRCNLRNHSGIA